MILGIRTDKPEAELYLYRAGQRLDLSVWTAHRELSETLLIKIEQLLANNKASLAELSGIIVYQGPGSFTGLRIGIATANTLAYTLGVPIAGAEDEGWLQVALKKIKTTDVTLSQTIIPEYGAQPHITAPRK